MPEAKLKGPIKADGEIVIIPEPAQVIEDPYTAKAHKMIVRSAFTAACTTILAEDDTLNLEELKRHLLTVK